jgi:methionyl-tRNA formyltransferase
MATDCGIATITPDDPNDADVVARIGALAPDFVFSFYYRQMLGAALLAIPRGVPSTCTGPSCRSTAGARR